MPLKPGLLGATQEPNAGICCVSTETDIQSSPCRIAVVTNSGLIRNNARGLALRQKLNSHCSALYKVGLPRSHSLLAEKW